MNEAAEKVWLLGVAPQLATETISALRQALADNDARIVPGATTRPLPLVWNSDWKCECCCPLAFCGMSEGLFKVGEVEEYFFKMCDEIDNILDEPAGCHYLINFIDEEPWDVVRRELIALCDRTLAERALAVA